MQLHYFPSPQATNTLSTEQLREQFLIGALFQNDAVTAHYTDLDRMIVGAAVPVTKPLTLPSAKETGTSFFLERREIGILNVGAGAGKVFVGGTSYELGALDCLYIGLGEKEVSFENVAGGQAQFFFISTPAHAKHPTAVVRRADVRTDPIGDPAKANRRRINKLIHPDGVKSCQLVMGFTEFDKMKKDVPINHDPALNAMVQRVGQRIAAVAKPDMPNAQWEFVVFDSKEANAFCLPGGKVGVYTGILPITKDDAGLATVLGHEVGHAVAHHGGERMTEAMGLQLGGQLVGSAAAQSKYQALIVQGYGLSSQLGVALPHSRKQESEADEIGIIYMARAGYQPQAAVDFWQRFSSYNSANGGGGTPWFLSTHPVDADRVAHLKQLLPRAQSEYRP